MTYNLRQQRDRLNAAIVALEELDAASSAVAALAKKRRVSAAVLA